ncbi:hypothetical protein EYF80_043687 [Liparis tanakae]|uniref:Uncharacterized protein n=1 Tax=Liparis tanakae TaxID=230148 RepID=A0A4Z2FYY3_9TELE|nr:hypothetical protein EYF80_043687 [Liparis tanakae]
MLGQWRLESANKNRRKKLHKLYSMREKTSNPLDLPGLTVFSSQSWFWFSRGKKPPIPPGSPAAWRLSILTLLLWLEEEVLPGALHLLQKSRIRACGPDHEVDPEPAGVISSNHENSGCVPFVGRSDAFFTPLSVKTNRIKEASGWRFAFVSLKRNFVKQRRTFLSDKVKLTEHCVLLRQHVSVSLQLIRTGEPPQNALEPPHRRRRSVAGAADGNISNPLCSLSITARRVQFVVDFHAENSAAAHSAPSTSVPVEVNLALGVKQTLCFHHR